MFITFEGIDLSGKTTQCTLLEAWLASRERACLSVREPGGTRISEQIRSLLLDVSHEAMDPVTELLLFSAARSQLIIEKILPALKAGVTVLADRFYDSTTAYQGYGRGIDPDAIKRIHKLATHGITPDLTFFFDLEYAETVRRREQRGITDDRMESAGSVFFDKVRDGYFRIAAGEPERFIIIDAARTVEEISENVIGKVEKRLGAAV